MVNVRKIIAVNIAFLENDLQLRSITQNRGNPNRLTVYIDLLIGQQLEHIEAFASNSYCLILVQVSHCTRTQPSLPSGGTWWSAFSRDV